MAITITKAEVKRKCMIAASDTTRDSDIDALVVEMQPGIEYGLDPIYLNDTSNTQLQALLKLGILEVISGELLQQLRRETGASEDLRAGGISLGAPPDHGVSMVRQGMERLRPFLRSNETPDTSGIASTADGVDRMFTNDTMRVW